MKNIEILNTKVDSLAIYIYIYILNLIQIVNVTCNFHLDLPTQKIKISMFSRFYYLNYAALVW